MSEQPSTQRVVFLVSVIQEGQAIIDALGLLEQPDHPHPMFVGEGGRVLLIVTGIGPKAAEDAVNQARVMPDLQGARWVNFGIAGHATHPIGSFFQVNHFFREDAVSGFPGTAPELRGFQTEVLRTYPEFVEDYPESGLVDMEGCAIADALRAHEWLDQLLVFKLVSDNREESQLATVATRQLLGRMLAERAREVLKAIGLRQPE